MHQSSLTWGQHCQCGRHNNQGQNISPKMPNVLRSGDCLNRHDRTMHNTRPNREPDKASVRHWITRCDNQEHTERGIDAHDHLQILGATFCMPRPTRRPENREWPHAENETNPDDYQSDAKILDAIGVSHVCPPFKAAARAPVLTAATST